MKGINIVYAAVINSKCSPVCIRGHPQGFIEAVWKDEWIRELSLLKPLNNLTLQTAFFSLLKSSCVMLISVALCRSLYFTTTCWICFDKKSTRFPWGLKSDQLTQLKKKVRKPVALKLLSTKIECVIEQISHVELSSSILTFIT